MPVRELVREVSSAPNYLVSVWGDVYSRPRKWAVFKGRRLTENSKGRFLPSRPTRPGERVRVNFGGLVRDVGAIVLEAFVGPRPEGLVCCHLNGDANDNHLENLKWGTRAESGAGRPRGSRP